MICEGYDIRMKQVRVMTIDDFKLYFDIKSEASSVYWGGFAKKPVKEELYNHFTNLLLNNKKNIYAVCEDKLCVGYIQCELFWAKVEVSVGILEKYRGNGYASYAINYIRDKSNAKFIFAWIRDDNISSIKAFQAAGFVKTNEVKWYHIENINSDVCMHKYVANCY